VHDEITYITLDLAKEDHHAVDGAVEYGQC
jgi:hypothetical protein